MSCQNVAMVLYICKKLIENNAAKLKGWGDVDDSIDLQMVLFTESARASEAMRYGAGTDEATAQGCVLTATAKMLRSLRGNLGGFKETAGEMRSRADVSHAVRAGEAEAPQQATAGAEGLDAEAAVDAGLQDWEMMQDNPFAHWEKWPQFNPMDFSGLFGERI